MKQKNILVRLSKKAFFPLMFVLFIGTLARMNRVFFKQNSGFCIHYLLYSHLPSLPDWDLPPLSPAEESFLDDILKQKFHYLGKGAHCYAFVSEDQKYVIKFHRFASHMRVFPWLAHPFSQFSEHRKKIKEYNIQKLHYNFQNYKNSYLDLKEQSGVILLHINSNNSLHRMVTLVDKMLVEYCVPLDRVTFILQYKANLIYPTLDKLIHERKIDEAKKVVSNIIQLIATSTQKGYVNNDPVLRKNYGLLPDQAIYIDIGDLTKNEKISLRENYIPHVKEMTESLRKRLQNTYPELLEHYYEEINSL